MNSELSRIWRGEFGDGKTPPGHALKGHLFAVTDALPEGYGRNGRGMAGNSPRPGPRRSAEQPASTTLGAGKGPFRGRTGPLGGAGRGPRFPDSFPNRCAAGRFLRISACSRDRPLVSRAVGRPATFGAALGHPATSCSGITTAIRILSAKL